MNTRDIDNTAATAQQRLEMYLDRWEELEAKGNSPEKLTMDEVYEQIAIGRGVVQQLVQDRNFRRSRR